MTAPSNPRAPLLSGARVLIRHPVDADRAELTALRAASRAWLAPWEPHTPEGGVIDDHQFVDRAIATADTQTGQRHVICRLDSGAIAGMCNLSQIFRGPFDNAVMGYWRGPAFGGRGLMTEGIALVLERAFGGLRLHRVEANIMPRNAPSKALAARCGFRFEGFSPNYLQIAGRWEGHDRYAITAEDWAMFRR